MPNKNASATRFSDISQINTDNVRNLKVAWTFSTGVLRGQRMDDAEQERVGDTLQRHQSNQYRQRQEPEGRLDVFHRGAAGAKNGRCRTRTRRRHASATSVKSIPTTSGT